MLIVSFPCGSLNEINVVSPTVEKIYLYNYGNECTDITGGWNSIIDNDSYSANCSLLKNSDNLAITSSGTASNCMFYTVNDIDLAEYSRICVKYVQSSVKAYSKLSGIDIDTWTTNLTILSSDFINSSDVIESAYDISNNKTNDEKIAIYVEKYSNNVVLNVYQIWLEKDVITE